MVHHVVWAAGPAGTHGCKAGQCAAAAAHSRNSGGAHRGSSQRVRAAAGAASRCASGHRRCCAVVGTAQSPRQVCTACHSGWFEQVCVAWLAACGSKGTALEWQVRRLQSLSRNSACCWDVRNCMCRHTRTLMLPALRAVLLCWCACCAGARQSQGCCMLGPSSPCSTLAGSWQKHGGSHARVKQATLVVGAHRGQL